MEPTVTICVPHHAGWPHLQTLLLSLRALVPDGPSYRTLIMDNASRDGSREMLDEQFPEVDILPLDANYGFAHALNLAAVHAQTEWIAFLNNDMRVHSRWLIEAMECAGRNNVDCVASHILNWNGTRTQFAGGEINLLGKGFEWTDEDCDVEAERDLLFACGGAMLIRRDLFVDAGGFDREYELIYEDVDLGWRLNLYGYKVRYAPRSRVYHRQHASLAQVEYRRKAVYYERNSLATMYKNLGAENWAVLMPALFRLAVHRTEALMQLPCDGYFHLCGVQAFFDHLTRWRQKRRVVQTRRQIPDEEVFRRFFVNPMRLWGYSPKHTEVLRDLRYQRDREEMLSIADCGLKRRGQE